MKLLGAIVVLVMSLALATCAHGAGERVRHGEASPLPDERDDPRACGSVRCPENQVCCNESCGYCTPPGGFCFSQECVEGALIADGGR